MVYHNADPNAPGAVGESIFTQVAQINCDDEVDEGDMAGDMTSPSMHMALTRGIAVHMHDHEVDSSIPSMPSSLMTSAKCHV